MKINLATNLRLLGVLLVSFMAVSCNPLSIETPPVLAGDFSDPIYPRTYGKVSVAVDIDSDNKAEASETQIKSLIVDFYFKTADGQMVLAKSYDKLEDIPQIVSFPIGQYVVIAHSADGAEEYFYGETQIEVTEQSKTVPNITCKLLADKFEDPIYPKVYGKVSIELSVEVDMSLQLTRSSIMPDKGSMIVEFYYIIDGGEAKLCKTYETYSSMPSVVSFPQGKYKIIVKSHPEMPYACSYAFFYGKAEMTVTESGTTTEKIKCQMQNTRLNVLPNEGFNKAFSSWVAKLTFNGATESQAEFSATNPRSIFIRPQDFTLNLTATQIGDNKVYTKSIPVSSVKPETDITITLSGQGSGIVNTEINITGNIDRNDHDVNFPDDDDELGDGGFNPNPNPNPNPKPDPSTPPTIIGEGFDVDQVKVISTANDFDAEKNLKTPLKVTATAKDGGIQQFTILIESPDIGPELLNPIFGGTSFDLANVPSGSNLEKNLNELGILPLGVTVKGKQSFTFDLTSFMSLLPENTLTHDFTLTIKDGKGNTISKTVKILRTL